MTITSQLIKLKVADKFKIRVQDLEGKSKVAKIAEARHVAVYLIRKLRRLPFATIGRLFNRSHATILHSWEQVHALASREDEFAQKVVALEEEIRQCSSQN